MTTLVMKCSTILYRTILKSFQSGQNVDQQGERYTDSLREL